jgi:cytochrome c2
MRRLPHALVIGALGLVAVACQGPPAAPAPPPPPAGSPAAQGQTLLAQKGCGGCHVIPGVSGATGNIGPSLVGIASKTSVGDGAVPIQSRDDMVRWIVDPPAMKPGTQMPKLNLTPDEADRMVAYLELLR